MNEFDEQSGSSSEQVDTEVDALCAECGTVNPDGVPKCVGCGNDLRQQHARRLTEEDTAELTQKREQRTQIVLGVLSFAGIVAVLLVAWNVTRIADWLTGVGGIGNPAAEFWRGEDAERFDALSRSARGLNFSSSAIAEIVRDNTAIDDLNGDYIITPPDAARDALLGTATVEQVDEALYFAAWILGEVELRGIARVDGERERLVISEGGARLGREYRQVFGFATPAEGNTFICSGQVEDIDMAFVEGRAHPVP